MGVDPSMVEGQFGPIIDLFATKYGLLVNTDRPEGGDWYDLNFCPSVGQLLIVRLTRPERFGVQEGINIVMSVSAGSVFLAVPYVAEVKQGPLEILKVMHLPNWSYPYVHEITAVYFAALLSINNLLAESDHKGDAAQLILTPATTVVTRQGKRSETYSNQFIVLMLINPSGHDQIHRTRNLLGIKRGELQTFGHKLAGFGKGFQITRDTKPIHIDPKCMCTGNAVVKIEYPASWLTRDHVIAWAYKSLYLERVQRIIDPDSIQEILLTKDTIFIYVSALTVPNNIVATTSDLMKILELDQNGTCYKGRGLQVEAIPPAVHNWLYNQHKSGNPNVPTICQQPRSAQVLSSPKLSVGALSEKILKQAAKGIETRPSPRGPAAGGGVSKPRVATTTKK